MERARNRCCGEREGVYLSLHLPDFFFCGDAEAVLFVHDEKTDISECDVSGEYPVGADDDVNPPLPQCSDQRRLLGLRAESRENINAYAVAGKPVTERIEVLHCQDCRGYEHSHLSPVEDGLERRAHGDFRLAESDVAADKTVHRVRLFHVLFHVERRFRLVERVLVHK